MSCSFGRCGAVVLGVALLQPVSGRAGDLYVVDSLADGGSGSLREAIEAANENPGADWVRIDVTGTILLTGGQLVILDDVVIEGPGPDGLTVSGGGAGRVFLIEGPAFQSGVPNVTLRGLAISDGMAEPHWGWGTTDRPGGGILKWFGTLHLEQVAITGNLAEAPDGIAWGAGMVNVGGELYLSDVVVADNVTEGVGAVSGGIFSLASWAEVGDSRFVGNVSDGCAGEGGAIYSRAYGYVPATLIVRTSRFEDNRSLHSMPDCAQSSEPRYSFGGAIGSTGSNLEVYDSWFGGNRVSGGAYPVSGSDSFGGAIATNGDATLEVPATARIERSIFRDNRAIIEDSGEGLVENSAAGGAIQVGRLSSIEVEDCRFDGNSTEAPHTAAGGALWSDGPSHVDGTRFDDNAAMGGMVGVAGGVGIGASGTLEMRDSAAVGNLAVAYSVATGGGLHMNPAGQVCMRDTVFKGNLAVATCEDDPNVPPWLPCFEGANDISGLVTECPLDE